MSVDSPRCSHRFIRPHVHRPLWPADARRRSKADRRAATKTDTDVSSLAPGHASNGLIYWTRDGPDNTVEVSRKKTPTEPSGPDLVFVRPCNAKKNPDCSRWTRSAACEIPEQPGMINRLITCFPKGFETVVLLPGYNWSSRRVLGPGLGS